MEAVLRRERAVVAAGLAVLAALAWMHIVRGAGMGMSAGDLTTITLFPHLRAERTQGMQMPASAWPTIVAMWWTMMVAMMTPSVAPLVLLYGRVLRHRAIGQAPSSAAYVPSGFLVAGYLAVWLAFSAGAAAIQYALQPAGLISPRMLWSNNAALSAVLLGAAGFYQITPFKLACLKHCRGPVEFLTRHWRPGRLGAFVMGIQHGAWCVGCCWMLMALLFVGGVMNLAWIAVLTLLVLVEKFAPVGPAIGKSSGAVLILWAIATVLV